MLVLGLGFLLVCATPFEDVRHRFSLDLPAGWVYAPQPGDTGGATFRRQTEGRLAHAAVRVLRPLPASISLRDFVDQLAAPSADEPGFHLLQGGPTTLAGAAAMRRRYVVFVNADPKFPKMVEQIFALIGDTGYLMHVETIAELFDGFATDFRQLEASFRPGSGAPEKPALELPPATGRALIGRWHGAGHQIRFTVGGAVLWDELPGTYQLDGGVLIVKLRGRRLQYQASLVGDVLQLGGEDAFALRRVTEAPKK